jgi:tetratricopeptide (TPR) repeat protein
LLETRYLSKPSASIASTLGKYYMNIQNDEKAKNYFDDAITLEKDSLKIATHHINKSKYLLANKKYNASFYEAKKAIKQDPNNATAYLIAGNAIAYSSSFCTELSFGGKELYWLAVDYYNQATKSAINEKERLSASEKIKKFQQYFPEKGDVFLKSLTEGSVYKVGCSFNENTRVRSLN